MNQRGFTHHTMMIGVALLVIGSVGFAGYRVYQNKNIDAQAANYNWSDLTNIFEGGKGGGEPKSVVTYYSCVQQIRDVKNVLIKATKKNDGNSPSIKLKTYTDGTPITYVKSGQTLNRWRQGTTLQSSIVAKTSPKEYVEVSFSDSGGGYSNTFDPGKVNACTAPRPIVD